MAYYVITRACGCDERVQICGSNGHGQREQQAARLAEQDCTECRNRARRAVNTLAADVAEAAGWPTLVGTTSQVAAANTIRGDLVAGAVAAVADSPAVPESVREQLVAVYVEILLRQVDASWWIAHQHSHGGRLAARLATDADRQHVAVLAEIAAGRTHNLTETE